MIMKDVTDFLSAALPWVCIGLLLAIFFAQSARKKKDDKKNENYSTEGMALGMCFGTAIGTSLGKNTGSGLRSECWRDLSSVPALRKRKETAKNDFWHKAVKNEDHY